MNLKKCLSLGLILFPGLCLQAQVLMINFSAAGYEPTLAESSSSPYHTANTSFNQTSWNNLQAADIAAGGLVWSNGATAANVSLNIGQNTNHTSINLSSTAVRVNRLGNGGVFKGDAETSSIYSDTTIGTGALFTTSSSANDTHAIGFQVGGLAAGTYDLYITARNTNPIGGNTQTVFAGVSTSTSNFTFTGYDSKSLTYPNSTSGVGATNYGTSAWVEDTNYVKFTVTLADGEVLNIAGIGGGADQRGFINSIQIVSAIPEPAAWPLLLGAGALGVAFLRRSRISRG